MEVSGRRVQPGGAIPRVLTRLKLQLGVESLLIQKSEGRKSAPGKLKSLLRSDSRHPYKVPTKDTRQTSRLVVPNEYLGRITLGSDRTLMPEEEHESPEEVRSQRKRCLQSVDE